MLLFYFCTLASGLFIYFCSILKELEFAIRQTHVHELNKNDMKLELTSYHESTNLHCSKSQWCTDIYIYGGCVLQELIHSVNVQGHLQV